MKTKKILIIDEDGFSRICSAILEFSGYGVSMAGDLKNLVANLKKDEVGLVITSYPYGSYSLEEIKKRNIPLIILSDKIDEQLMKILNDFQNSCCMIKPIDYDRFRAIVNDLMTGKADFQEGYNIV